MIDEIIIMLNLIYVLNFNYEFYRIHVKMENYTVGDIRHLLT